MTESECHDFLVQTCKQLMKENSNLLIEIRNPSSDDGEWKFFKDVAFVVLFFSKDKKSRLAYHVTKGSFTYMSNERLVDVLKELAEKVQNNYIMRW